MAIWRFGKICVLSIENRATNAWICVDNFRRGSANAYAEKCADFSPVRRRKIAIRASKLTVSHGDLLCCGRNSAIMEIVGDYKYNTKELIGHGAFAVVYKGYHIKVSDPFLVCLKNVPKQSFNYRIHH